jgi:transcriptional regulator with XRE-family HTH domain
MVTSAGIVQGELLRWARQQQGLSMRDVAARAGISPGYQSEVERGVKREVRGKMLNAWLTCLHVTEAFARGEVPRYAVEPDRCKGLAADVGAALQTAGVDWANLSPTERVRHVLRLIASESTRVPRVVLAYLFHLDVATLDHIIQGETPLGSYMAKGVSDLAAIPELFLRTGRWGNERAEDVLQELLPAIRFALELNFTGQDLKELILTTAYTRALRSSRSGEQTSLHEDRDMLLEMLSGRMG